MVDLVVVEKFPSLQPPVTSTRRRWLQKERERSIKHSEVDRQYFARTLHHHTQISLDSEWSPTIWINLWVCLPTPYCWHTFHVTEATKRALWRCTHLGEVSTAANSSLLLNSFLSLLLADNGGYSTPTVEKQSTHSEEQSHKGWDTQGQRRCLVSWGSGFTHKLCFH